VVDAVARPARYRLAFGERRRRWIAAPGLLNRNIGTVEHQDLSGPWSRRFQSPWGHCVNITDNSLDSFEPCRGGLLAAKCPVVAPSFYSGV
jgi:hypothetical protein